MLLLVALFSLTKAAIPILYSPGAQVLTMVPTPVYLIFYGSFTPLQTSVIVNFVQGISRTTYWNINKKYTSTTGPSTSSLIVAKYIIDSYSQGTSLIPGSIPIIIRRQISLGQIAESSDAIYLVIASPDVTEQFTDQRITTNYYPMHFCKEYCAYHQTFQTSSTTVLKYAFIGNPATNCASACIPNLNNSTSPNFDVGVDAVINMVAQQLIKIVSDPYTNDARAWSDANGMENGDKCAWMFGPTYNGPNRSNVNIQVGVRHYLVQMNWDPQLQACAQA